MLPAVSLCLHPYHDALGKRQQLGQYFQPPLASQGALKLLISVLLQCFSPV